MYQLTNSASIRRISDNASIPNDPANSDYAKYLNWVSKGNTPTPVDPPPVPTISELLAKLDTDNELTQRNLREFILLTTQAIKVATSGAVDLSQIRGVAMVATVEAQAAALRTKL